MWLVLGLLVLTNCQVPGSPPEYMIAFMKMATNEETMNEIIDAEWKGVFKPQSGKPGDKEWNAIDGKWDGNYATERTTQLLTDAAMIADATMHSLRHNHNARKLGMPIMWLPIKATGKFPSNKITYWKDFLDKNKWSANDCDGILKKYVVKDYQSIDILSPAVMPSCMQLMEYLGLQITGDDHFGDYPHSASPELGVYRLRRLLANQLQ